MPKRLTDERIQAIAQNYCTNGYIKSKALLDAGYSESYSEHNGLKLFDNDRVKAEIAKIMAETAKNTQITVEYIQSEHQRLALLAEAKGDLPTATRNKELTGKTIAAYIDRSQTDKPIEPKQFTDKELETLKQQAKELTKPGLRLVRGV